MDQSIALEQSSRKKKRDVSKEIWVIEQLTC